MKKLKYFIAFLIVFVWSLGLAQEAKETHTRGLLHQSVFNSGALGSQWCAFRTLNSGDSTQVGLEWPGNSLFRYNNNNYWYYNSGGGGIVMLCDTGKPTTHQKYLIADPVLGQNGVDVVGCLSSNSGGQYRDGQGLFYWTGSVTKRNNFPLNSDGTWNTSYDPTEAEEIITSSVYTPYGITINRTSRAWSYPGYDSFIIYDYEFKNTGFHYKNAAGISPTHATDTLFNIIPTLVEYFFPSYAYANRFLSGGMSTGVSNQMISRFDLRRYMQYVHHADGRPDPLNYDNWSMNGTFGGGLTAPAAVGYMLLYYDYNKLMPINTTTSKPAYIDQSSNEALFVYDKGQSDPTSRFKQPWVIATTQTNLSATKIQTHVGGSDSRPYRVWNPRFTGASDSANLVSHYNSNFASYWYGRGKPNNNYNFSSPMVHSYATGPYKLAPDEAFHVVYAELAGFGPGRKADSRYFDYGGGNETVLTGDLFHPIPSWDDVITYTNAPSIANATFTGSATNIGIKYIPTYGYPAYIRDTNVISIRDVADRCIQLYKGNANVIKYDTSQYEPNGDPSLLNRAPSPSEIATRLGGWNASIKMPLPAPVLAGVVDSVTISGLRWGPSVDAMPSVFRSLYNSAAAYYRILRATSALGPWNQIDSVGVKDPRFWNASLNKYAYLDSRAAIGSTYYYVVIPVDSAGKKGGFTNMLMQQANLPAYSRIGLPGQKVYASPNPFIMVSGYAGETFSSNNRIQFFGLSADVTIRIFSFSGQLIKTLYSKQVHAQEGAGDIASCHWDLLSESGKKIASGVYYFTVTDNVTGARTWNKFVVIH